MVDIRKWAEENGVEIEELPLLPPVSIGTGPWKIYVYRKDGYHSGGKWFRRGTVRYPDEEITASDAKERADEAIARKCEVRICDGDDRLVFHSEHGRMIYPATPGEFWRAAGITT
jgi:hypothetical protein